MCSIYHRLSAHVYDCGVVKAYWEHNMAHARDLGLMQQAYSIISHINHEPFYHPLVPSTPRRLFFTP
jgi:ADP-glucose pyrophosphorylase